MQLRRFNDILAVKTADDTLLAFHARNLEVAQISEEAWNSMAPTSLVSSAIPVIKDEQSESLNELRTWNFENSPEVKSNKIEFGIRFLTINVSQICNLHCNYCAAGGDGTFGDAIAKISIEKTLPQIKFFLDRLPAKASFNISFLGGEPLMYADGLDMIAKYVAELAPDRPVNYTVITNGTLLNDKNVEILARMKATITVSLDGPPEINDIMRPTKNGTSSTAMVVTGLNRVIERKSEFAHLMIHGVFDSNNMQMLKAYEFYSQFDVDSYDFSFSVSENAPRASQDFMNEMSALAAVAYARGGEAALRKIRAFDQHFVSLDQQRRTENYCGAGKSFLMIDARNRIYTCPWDVNEKSEQVGAGTELDMEALEKYQAPILEANKCENCWARFLCGGGCMFAHKHGSGDKNIKNTQFCERTRFMVALALIYYEKSRSAA